MDEIKERRRALIDALYAIHVPLPSGGHAIRVDEALALALERAWDAYDEVIRRGCGGGDE